MAIPRSDPTALVVIGASSADGDALLKSIPSFPADLDAPVILIERIAGHLARVPTERLEQVSNLPIVEMDAPGPVGPGRIYRLTPERVYEFDSYSLQIGSTSQSGCSAFPALFASAGRHFGDELIAVILSGVGAAGADAARTVRLAGGVVIAQDPQSNGFVGYPQSLSPTDLDVVCPPEKIGPIVASLLDGVYERPETNDESQLQSFLELLRHDSGIDFATYKQPTILRRMNLRMTATGLSSISEYARYVRRHPEEQHRLLSSFLIKVTEFFRDPDLFEYVQSHLLPELVKEARNRDNELRLWSAGCATGEEAYSLAIALSEVMGDDHPGLNFRIFATDLDEAAIAFARRGVYPASALQSVPENLVRRYFTHRNGEYEVSKALRSMIVFGEHDLGHRAPFPRVDLIFCRNVLIYFTAPLQRRALQLFAFSLRAGGYLAVGKSETVGPLSDFFAVDEPRLKVFRRVGDRVLTPSDHLRDVRSSLPPARAPLPRLGISSPSGGAKQERNSIRSRGGSGGDFMLHELPVGVVLVNRDYDIQSINAAARRQFGIHSNALDRDLLHLVKHVPIDSLRKSIDRAAAGERVSNVTLSSETASLGARAWFDVTCYPVSTGEDAEVLVAVVVQDVTSREQMKLLVESSEAMVQQLTKLNDEVISANEELTGSIAKLRAENEELLVAAEEFQAATEEVETLNEELQASNEELETLNEELHATVEELNTTNDDLEARTIELQEMAVASEGARARLEAILDNIGEAVVVVDRNGGIVIANPSFYRMFELDKLVVHIEEESGEALPPSASPIARASRGELFTMTFTTSMRGAGRRWFEAEGRPIPGGAQSRLGVVTFRDITDRSLRHLQEEWLALASHELRTPLTALQVYLQLAARPFQEKPDDPIGENLERAVEQAKRIGSIVRQIVDAARYQLGERKLEQDDVDLASLSERTSQLAAEVFGDARIHLELPTDRDRLIVSGSHERIQHLLYLVIEKAIGASPDDRAVQLHLQRNGDHAEFTIRAWGDGISQNDASKLFEPFYRGSKSDAPGLGMYIAREIAEQHGGAVDALDTNENGNIFRVRLPLKGPMQ